MHKEGSHVKCDKWQDRELNIVLFCTVNNEILLSLWYKNTRCIYPLKVQQILKCAPKNAKHASN